MTTDRLVSNPPTAASTPPERDVTGPLAAMGAVSGLGAVVASSCCVLPLVLAAVGAGGAIFSGFEILAAYQMYIFGAAVLLLAGAWIAFWRRARAAKCTSDGSCARPATPRLTLIVLAIATLFVTAAAGWAFIEPILLRAIQ